MLNRIFSGGKRTVVIARPAIAQRVAILVLLILLATACATAVPPATLDPTVQANSSRNTVTLVLWHGWSGTARQTLSRLVETFNNQHPDGQVVLQSVSLATFDGDLRSALAAGSGPHIVLIPNTWVGSLADIDALLPLDNLIPDNEQQALLPATLGGARARGTDNEQHLYGIPVSFDTLALYYNTANLLTPPTDTATLIQSARGLGAPDADQPRWGFALNLSLENTIGYLYAAGGRIFDDNGQVVLGNTGRAGAEQWLTWLSQLKDDQQILARADSSIQIDRELKDGHVLMTFDWAHQLSFYRNLWGQNFGIAPLPRLSETNQLPQPYVRSDILAINNRASSAERQAALTFLRFMIASDTQHALLKSDLQPARANLSLTSDDLDSQQSAAAQAFRNQAQNGQPMPNGTTQTRDLLRRELAQMQRQVLRGEASPAEAVGEADQDLRTQLGQSNP